MQKFSLFAASIAAFFLVLPAQAHDFWIEPERHSLPSGSNVMLSAKVGHGEDQSAWPLEPHRVVGLRSFSEHGARNHLSDIPTEASGGKVSVTGIGDGTHVILIESINSFSELPPEKFASYVEEEGVRPIADHRKSIDRSARPGKELYSRRGKTLVQIGEASKGADHILKPVGATLEIVPLVDPFQLRAGESFHLQVLYYGRPVSGATLHVTQLDQPDTGMVLKTNAEGVARAPELAAGRWMFHTVWSQPVEGLLNGADYLTVFSSLSFAIDQ